MLQMIQNYQFRNKTDSMEANIFYIYSSVGLISGTERDFLSSTVSGSVLRPGQPPIQWVPGLISPGIKRPKREFDLSHPCSAEVKYDEALPPVPHMSSWLVA
jgi:hypothetical protein